MDEAKADLRNAMYRPVLAAIVSVILVALSLGPAGPKAGESETKTFSVHPIGEIQKQDGRSMIVLDKQYQKGLLGLAQWTHVQVLWWFDKNDTPQKRAILQVHPRGDKNNPLTGVFACRAPVRPNLIALSLCKIVSVKDNVVEIEKIDAFEGTPVLDLKPYAPGLDSASDVKVPQWARHDGRDTALLNTKK